MNHKPAVFARRDHVGADDPVGNILVRRYVGAEPVLVLTAEVFSPVLALTKSGLTVFDPVNATTNPKAIPGAWVEFTLIALNSGAGSADPDSIVVTESLPDDVALYVGDIAGPSGGPIEFTDGPGSSASGLMSSSSESCHRNASESTRSADNLAMLCSHELAS